MYEKGSGVPKDYKMAVNWYSKAAEQGKPLAQDQLGIMYFYGKGVSKDYVTAYMFFNIAAVNGDERIAENREIVAEQMTSSQIEKAQRRTREWMQSHQ
jgi:hypothetical protein